MGLNEYIQIGNRIKGIRTKKGLKQRQVATDLNIPYSTYSNYENNNREPSYEVLQQIAKYFDVSIAELISDEAVAEEEHQLFQTMCDYLDELGCQISYDSESGRYSIDSSEYGSLGIFSEGDLQSIFSDINKRAENAKDRYILKSLDAEFDITKKK